MKRSQMIAALKANNIPFKGNASNKQLADLIAEHNIVVETPTIVEQTPSVPRGTLSMKISIDQSGLGADKGLGDNRLDYFYDFRPVEGQVIDLRRAAGNFAKQIHAGIQMLKDRGKGYNLTFSVDNELVAGFRHGVNGRISFGNPIDLAHGLLQFIASQFDMNGGAELFGEAADNSGEIKLMLKKFNLDENMPLVFAQKAINLHRKAVKKQYAPVKA